MRLEDTKKFGLSLGVGSSDFSMTKGSFQYQEQLDWKQEVTLSSKVQQQNRICYSIYGAQGEAFGELEAVQNGTLLHLRFSGVPERFNRFWLTLPSSAGEHFYGCGETFSEFDLKGQDVRIWVAEHQNEDRLDRKICAELLHGKQPQNVLPFSVYESYYAQPTAISSQGYFLHVDSTAYMEFWFSRADSTTIYLHEAADIFIGTADSFEKLSGLLSGLLGHQPPLPDWLYDGVTLAVQTGVEAVEQKLAAAERHGIPVNGIWCQDWCGFRKTTFGYQVMWNWKVDEGLYPDLKERIARWKRKNIRFLGYINPFLAIEKPLYQEAVQRGYCVKNRDGKDYLVTITTFPAAMIDFTNPAAYQWYKDIIKENLIGIGLSGWMADFGEYLPTDCVLYSGESPESIHNRWPAIWARMNREAIQECGKEGEVFFFTRAGHTGTVPASTLMWNGDQHVDWSVDDGMPSVIPAALSLGLSGFGLVHSDTGGYTTNKYMTRSRELLMRWEELTAFSPYMRFHEGNQPQRNVQFDGDEELLEHLARMAKVHIGLKPYLKDCVSQCSEAGIPLMRPLFYHYPEKNAWTEKTEYLLGRDVLVAPVLIQGAETRSCYLPRDEWIYLPTGEHYSGGTVIVSAPVGTPPVFIRAESKWKELLIKITEPIRIRRNPQ